MKINIKHIAILLLGTYTLHADSIIDFGNHEKKNYTPSVYSPNHSNPNSNVQQLESSQTNQILQTNLQEISSFAKPPILKGDEFFNHYIKDRPKGIVRDFYIWQYLNENKLSAAQINEAYKLLNAKNPYLRRTLDKLGKTEKMPRDVECGKMSVQTALKQDDACLVLAIKGKLSAFKTLSAEERNIVITRLEKTHKDTVEAIKILASKERTSKLFTANAIVFAMVYHALSYEEKQKMHTDNPAQNLKKLSEYKTQGFYNILNAVILDSGLHNIKKMLLASDITEAPHGTLFLLGINELRFGSKEKAMEYFKRVKKSTTMAFFLDRATFWQYLVSNDKKYLEELAQSKHVDIFSIYATQTLKKKPNYIIVEDLPSLSHEKPPFDIRDPYTWQDISSTMISPNDPTKLIKAIPYFSYKDSLPQLTYLMQKIDKYSKNYYITPYEGLVTWKSKEEQSLVFSIARQESYFIPTLISRSFALGIMQIMPANVKPFAKEMGRDDIEYNDLFDPKTALEMGRHFIRQLQKEYKHPLFVAYAYNGGPGFLRRLLAKNELFLQNRDYEPWLSMELIPYEESRLYGMRVLANFIIYEKLFGKEIQVQDLLKQTLIYKNDKITK